MSAHPSRSLRTLVVSPNWVGDTVMSLPVLAALAESGREVTVLAPSHLHPLLALSPSVDCMVAKGASGAETVSRMKEAVCDEAVLLPNSFRAAWLAYRARIPARFGYRGDGRSLLLAPAVHRPPGKTHQLRDYDRLLRKMGVSPSPEPPGLTITEEIDGLVETALAAAGVSLETGEPPLVGVFPGAEFGSSKRWPVERFAAVTKALIRSPAVRPILIAGPKEVKLAETLRQRAGAVPVLGPDLDLGGLAGLLARTAVLVTNDSGPMHLAAAVGTRCVAIFGPTDPSRTSPIGSEHRVLYRSRWCSPCFRRRCPLFHHRCMTEIEVEHVEEAIKGSLDQS